MHEKELYYIDKINIKLEELRNSLQLEKLKTIMENDSEVLSLNRTISLEVESLNELLRYMSEDSKEVKEIIANLSKLRSKLANMESVKNYNDALKTYNEYIDFINKELFDI